MVAGEQLLEGATASAATDILQGEPASSSSSSSPFFHKHLSVFFLGSVSTVLLRSQTIFHSLLLLKNMICCFAETPISQTHSHLTSSSPVSDLLFFFHLDWFWAFFAHRLMSSTFPASQREVVMFSFFSSPLICHYWWRQARLDGVDSFNITTSGPKHTWCHIKRFFQGNWYLQQHDWCKTSRKRHK